MFVCWRLASFGKIVVLCPVVLLSPSSVSGAADVAAGAYMPGPGAGFPDLDREVMESRSSVRLSSQCKHAEHIHVCHGTMFVLVV